MDKDALKDSEIELSPIFPKMTIHHSQEVSSLAPFIRASNPMNFSSTQWQADKGCQILQSKHPVLDTSKENL